MGRRMKIADILKRASAHVGGMAALSRELGVARSAPYSWERVPAGRVLRIEEITGGRLSRHTMRPDLYPCD
jgi:DNA-binding transcriptional regulator YdaS (Cro superfamily)